MLGIVVKDNHIAAAVGNAIRKTDVLRIVVVKADHKRGISKRVGIRIIHDRQFHAQIVKMQIFGFKTLVAVNLYTVGVHFLVVVDGRLV